MSVPRAAATAEIVNPLGLHARPAARLTQLAETFRAEIMLRCGDRVVDARSLLALLTLDAAFGRQLDISATGDDALAAVDAVVALVAMGFGDLAPESGPSSNGQEQAEEHIAEAAQGDTEQ